MKNPSDTSSLLRSIVAGLQKKRKGQADEIAPEMPTEGHDEADMAQPEERHEVDILCDMQKVCDKIEDPDCIAELQKLIDEMGALHKVDVTDLEESTEADGPPAPMDGEMGPPADLADDGDDLDGV